ncbi:AAA family ATPase [Thermosulfurimonas dismutans]|uniref:ATP-dependent Clp protease ATP-binding subunit ClpX n=1 Tax=Thermosulfurimonas dismutans TaxID=999894 RepID=A0A179D507_9BACT|nr:AAA family ATPase [Thermosulfurimonas dismutans]OAQ21165.1 ATP-dependent Clp protease ATP-binding subunit ClpX [Thermosulfurimonas dismutans]
MATRFNPQRINWAAREKSSLANFALKPEELEAYLDEYVVGQREAKGILSTKICTHFHRVKYLLERGERFDEVGFVKNNIIIIGPTGVGKTFIVKLIARKIGVPFVKGDATKFSETGYVGGDVEDLIRDLVQEADGNLEKARFGIVYLDEVDKIASSGNVFGPDVSRTGVQRALLKPLEETEVELRVPHDPISQMEAIEYYRRTGRRKRNSINTRYILFIASGAFNGLEEIIRKRLRKQKLGFLSELEGREEVSINYLRFVTPEDLITYGFESEFVGRFPVIAVFDPLEEKDFFEILANPNSVIVVSKKRDFKAYGIDLAFTDEALRELARRAARENTGARALSRVLERVLIPFEKSLPSLGVSFLGVSREIVLEPEKVLSEMKLSPENPRWRVWYEKALKDEEGRTLTFLETRKKSFFENYRLPFTPAKLELALLLHRKEDLDLQQALEELLMLWRQIRSFEKSFERRSRLKVYFSEGARDLILSEVIKKDEGVYAFCDRILSVLEYGLKLVGDKTGKTIFELPEEAVRSPEEYLNQLVRSSYHLG